MSYFLPHNVLQLVWHMLQIIEVLEKRVAITMHLKKHHVKTATVKMM